MTARAYIGTVGWSLPRREQPRFPAGASHLARYAAVLSAVEVDSTFHRSHRASTYARWARSVPESFRFSMTVPKTITHEPRTGGTGERLDAFLREIAPLGPRVGCLLARLPPSLELTLRTARSFLAALREGFEGAIAVEPRHATWFGPEADRMLESQRIARVAADATKAANGGEPGGWKGLAYFRLRGSPRVEGPSHGEESLERLAERLRELQRAGIPCWCIFDNTPRAAGTANALALMQRLRAK